MTAHGPTVINLHIGRLVLDDLDSGTANRQQLAVAVQEQLSQLLAAGRLQPRYRDSTACERVAGGAFPLGNADPAAGLGLAIAQAVYNGIGEPLHQANRSFDQGRQP